MGNFNQQPQAPSVGGDYATQLAQMLMQGGQAAPLPSPQSNMPSANMQQLAGAAFPSQQEQQAQQHRRFYNMLISPSGQSGDGL